MNLNIREMISGTPCRLRYVFRYSTSRVSHPESVAEHSFYVAFYSMLIYDWYEAQKPTFLNPDVVPGAHSVLSAELLRRALLHDLEEARTGDFPRPFKHSTPEVHDLLEKTSRLAYGEIVKALVGISPAGDRMQDAWTNSKDNSIIGRILEFADFLAVLSFMTEEGAGQGNRSIEGHVKEMDKYFEKFASDKFDFIRPLIGQTVVMMQETFPKGDYIRFKRGGK